MAKLTTQGNESLPPGRYVLEILEMELADDSDPAQLRVRYRVADGEYAGYEFTDYPSRSAGEGVKVDTALVAIIAGVMESQIDLSEEFSKGKWIGRKVGAMVSVKSGRAESAPAGSARSKKSQPQEGGA